MNEFPPIRVLVAVLGTLLSQSQLFDVKREKDSIWISGTHEGVAFTCELKIEGARDLYDKQFKILYPELG